MLAYCNFVVISNLNDLLADKAFLSKVYLVTVSEDEAVSVYDGVLGSVLLYSFDCSCECMVSGPLYAFSVFCSKGPW